MRILFAICLSLFFSLTTIAQQTAQHTDNEKPFYKGKELYETKKFEASVIYLREYLNQPADKRFETVQACHYYLAANAFELHREDVIPQLQSYIQTYPHSPFVNRSRFLLGSAEYEIQDFENAANNFAEVNADKLEEEEQDDYHFRYGYTLLQLQNYRESKDYFSKLLGKGSRYETAATYYHAYNEYTLKNYTSALEGFQAVQEEEEYAGFVPYYIVQILYYQRQYSELIPIAEKLIERNPENKNNTELYRILGDCYYQKKDYRKTIDNLTKYQELAPKVVRNDMYLLGISHFNLEEYDNAATNLAKVTVEKDSLSQNAYFHLGLAYLNLNQKNNALLSFQQASVLDFDKDIQEEAAYNYALTTYELSFSPFNESVSAFEDFLTKYPNSQYVEKVHNYLVNVYMTTNNYEAAYASMQKIKQPGPRILEAKQRVLYNMGVDAFKETNYDKAIELFGQSLGLSVYNANVSAQARYWRGESYFRKENYVAARKDYSDFLVNPGARTTPEEFKLANYAIGYTYFNEKNYVSALPPFRKYTLDTNNSKSIIYIDALNRIGDCYFSARDMNNALKYYSEAASSQVQERDYSIFQKGFVLGLQKDFNGKIRTMQELISAFPTSEYRDDAMYEVGHSLMMLEEYDKSISAYNDLYEAYPTSSVTRKGMLQKGMLYYNMNQYDDAIKTYKEVISLYPQSEEATTAIESLESIYVQTNQINTYLAYTKTLKDNPITITAEKEDSLTFIASERQYLLGHFDQAEKSLDAYLQKYPEGKFTSKVRYYLADCYYRSGNLKALNEYEILMLQTGSPYMEVAVERAADLYYKTEDCSSALTNYQKLIEISENKTSIFVAKLGILRCNALLGNYQATIAAANEITADEQMPIEQIREAQYYRAKACIALNVGAEALPDLAILIAEPRSAFGAEANYLLANYYAENKSYDEAEQTIFSFIEKNSPHQYWLAKCFILLSDIYVEKGDDFQAKQYLLSLQESYTQQDEIQSLISERLTNIEIREKEKIITKVE